MKYQKALVSLVAIFALAISLIAGVSASSIIVEVSGVTGDIAVFAGQTLPVRVIFSSDIDASDVRVKAWISGEQAYAVSTERFAVIEGKTYSRLVSVQIPSNIDPLEDLELKVLVESRDNTVSIEGGISLSTQRESYNVELLDVDMASEVRAGTSLPIDIVLKNRGYQFAEDTFVKVKIPALGIEQKAYFGDLSPVDQSNPDKEDSAEKRIVLSIPSSAQSGIYLVELTVYNADSSSVVTKKVVIVGEADKDSSAVDKIDNKSTKGSSSNATLVLTIVLAIIFVVLLVVLIVLLTRKPENKAEEFGESYY